MEDGTTAYNVIYQDGVTVLSRADTMRHLLAIRRDGSYVFDSSASQIASLEPGSILLLSGLALCTVVDVKETSGGYLIKTGPAKITDAIKDGRLEGTYRIDFSRMQTIVAQGAADFDVDFGGYNYHVKFTPGDDRIQVQATIKYGGSQGTLAYEGIGYLSNFVSTIKMQIKDGELTNLSFTQCESYWPDGAEVVCGGYGCHEIGVHGQDHFLAGRALEERPALQSRLSCPYPGGSGAIRSADIARLQLYSRPHLKEQRR